MKYQLGRMGKAIACPSVPRVAIDGHVVPPLPILQFFGDDVVFLVVYE